MTESDISLELNIDCPVTTRSLPGLSSGLASEVQVQEISANLSKPKAAVARLLPGHHALCFNVTGALWLRTSAPPERMLVPANSATFIRGGTKLSILASRGEQRLTILTWQSSLSSALENWILGKAGARHAPIRVMASQALTQTLTPSVERFRSSIQSQQDSDPLFISALFEMCGHILGGPDVLRLAREPANLPESLTELILAVREEPTAPWPLADAATRAGYSPFHFSRVFKATVGCGFHEYVERCRTELAIEMLVSTNNPVDVVASSAGFGTPQSLRDSMKEYVGFVPSELRGSPENSARFAAAQLG